MEGPYAAQHPLPGQHVVESLLAEGRSARVYRVRAKDGSLRAARVARHDLDEASRAWFEADARLRKSLDHPNLPRTFLVARLPSGEPVEVVELLPSPDLSARLDAAPRGLALSDAARVLGELAAALAHLHRQPRPLAHGALTPDRVGFRPRDGAVKLRGVGSADSPRRAPLAYRSPESVDGAPPTPASDVFSLATLGFEILTGRAAFPEGPPRSTPDAWPSAHRIRAELPEAVDAVLARAWALDPTARHASAAEFSRALVVALGLAPAAPPAPEEVATLEVTVPVRHLGRAQPPGTRPSVPPPTAAASVADPAPPEDAFDPTPLDIVSPPDRPAPSSAASAPDATPQAPTPLPHSDAPTPPTPHGLAAREGPVHAPEDVRAAPVAPASEPPQMAPPRPGKPARPEPPVPARAPHPIEAEAPAAFRAPPPTTVGAASGAWLRQPTLVLPPQPSHHAWHRSPGVLAAMLISAAVLVAGLGHAVALALRPVTPAAITVSPQHLTCPPCPVCRPATAPSAPSAPARTLPATPPTGTRPEARRVAVSPSAAPRRAPAAATGSRPTPRPNVTTRPARAPSPRLIQQTPF